MTRVTPPAGGEFLREYFRGTDGRIYLGAIRNPKSKLGRGEIAHLVTRNSSAIDKFIASNDKPELEAAIYFCTATLRDGQTKRDAAACREFPSLFADCDDHNHELDLARVFELLEGCECPPTMIVDSGHGLQPHWLLSEPSEDADRIIAARKKLHAIVASDAVHDAPRFMRVPGSHNSKRGDWLAVEVVSHHPERRYSIEVLEEWLDTAAVVIPRKAKAKANGSGAAHDKPFEVPPSSGAGTDHKRGAAWARRALDESARELASSAEGSRHNTLRDKAVRMGTMIARGWIDVLEVRRPLFAASQACGQIKDYGDAHFDETFAAGIKYGMGMPHPDLPDDEPPRSGEQSNGPADAADPDLVPAAVLDEMNAIYATVSIAGKFRVLTFGPHPLYPLQRVPTFSTKTDFLNHVVTPKITVTEKTKDGESKQTKKPRGQWWINHPDHRRFDDIDFLPGGPNPIQVADTRVSDRIICKANMFAGWSVAPAKGDCRLYLNHMRDHVCQGDKQLYEYTLAWMASGVQHPGNPARIALSLRGLFGSGKGVFATEYGKIFGHHFLSLTQRDHVVGKFNAHGAEACLIFADEALFVGDARDADIIKTLISEQTKMIERKGIDAVPVANFSRLISATNHDHPHRIEVHDRRFCSYHVIVPADMTGPAGADKRKSYFVPIIRQMENGGRAALLDLLLGLDITTFNPEAIPQTEELALQKLLSASPGDQAIIAIAQDGCLPGALITRPWIARAHADNDRCGLLDHMKHRGGRSLEHASDNALSDILKRWGFEKKKLNDGSGWSAPNLPALRRQISEMFPAVEWKDTQTQWGQSADADESTT
jgi:hypothetical protein